MIYAYLFVLAAGLPHPQDNLAFERNDLTHWHGTGFHLTPANGNGPSLTWAVCSADGFAPKGSGKALLHRTLVVPINAGAIRFRAAYLHPKRQPAQGTVDVFLEVAGRKKIRRFRRLGSKLISSRHLSPLERGQLVEYEWPVADYAGKVARITLVDDDERPGCSLVCGGFEFVSLTSYQNERFRREMAELVTTHRMPEAEDRQTTHFFALSTATSELTDQQLTLCETIYALFYQYFRNRGFRLNEPYAKLMVAVFDSQAGMEAYVGERMSPMVTGFYHPKSNRLVVYDYAQNRSYLDALKQGRDTLRTIPSTMRKQRVVSAFQQDLRDRRTQANISTLMHEVAHQLSFNSGMLNRESDVPLWLAEGLACFCEPSEAGGWQGIGGPNRYRVSGLTNPAKGNGNFLPLRELLVDDWLHRGNDTRKALLGYSQSWALFHMLVTEHPAKLRRYIDKIDNVRTAESRVVDFAEVFGPDLSALEHDYVRYMKQLVETHGQ